MNLGITKEEAQLILDAINYYYVRMTPEFIKILYGDSIDLSSIITKLGVIIEIAPSGEEWNKKHETLD